MFFGNLCNRLARLCALCWVSAALVNQSDHHVHLTLEGGLVQHRKLPHLGPHIHKGLVCLQHLEKVCPPASLGQVNELVRLLNDSRSQGRQWYRYCSATA